MEKHKMNEAAIVTNLPDNILEAIFSYLDLRELRNCSLVCKNWYRYLNDENNDVWRMHCIRKLAEDAIKSDLLSSVPTYKAKLRAFFHAWNPNDCSRNVYIKTNGFTLHRWVLNLWTITTSFRIHSKIDFSRKNKFFSFFYRKKTKNKKPGIQWRKVQMVRVEKLVFDRVVMHGK